MHQPVNIYLFSPGRAIKSREINTAASPLPHARRFCAPKPAGLWCFIFLQSRACQWGWDQADLSTLQDWTEVFYFNYFSKTLEKIFHFSKLRGSAFKDSTLSLPGANLQSWHGNNWKKWVLLTWPTLKCPLEQQSHFTTNLGSSPITEPFPYSAKQSWIPFIF